MTVAIAIDDLSKRYQLGAGGGYRRLTETLRLPFRGSSAARSKDEFWALRHISFEVAESQVLGIIGRNGAGKSTLLKILSRITEPTEGRATLRGRVGSLLEVGTGFHPELSGRENIYLNGAVLGMRRSEISQRFDEIVEFAEVTRFLDTPVKRYSSGMYVRLAFAVAAHLEPEILIIDEVLAVGDVAFQRKCLGKMGDVAQSGRTVLFVSHSMAAIESLCDRAVLLDQGTVAVDGSVQDAIGAYVSGVASTSKQDLSGRVDREGDGRLRAVEFCVGSGLDSQDGVLVCGQPGTISVAFAAREDVGNVRAAVSLYDERGDGVLQLDSGLTGDDLRSGSGGGRFVCSFDRLPLLPGRYRANIYIDSGGGILDWVQDAAVFDVEPGDYYGTGRLPRAGYGHVVVDHRWSLRSD